MTWDWVEYVRVAGTWVPSTFNTARDQALVRSIVSRSYYAAFNRAKSYAFKKGWFTPDRKKLRHGEVWDIFQHRQRTEDEREIGAIGSGFMDDRHIADYELSFACAKKTCDHAINRANKILALLGPP